MVLASKLSVVDFYFSLEGRRRQWRRNGRQRQCRHGSGGVRVQFLGGRAQPTLGGAFLAGGRQWQRRWRQVGMTSTKKTSCRGQCSRRSGRGCVGRCVAAIVAAGRRRKTRLTLVVVVNVRWRFSAGRGEDDGDDETGDTFVMTTTTTNTTMRRAQSHNNIIFNKKAHHMPNILQLMSLRQSHAKVEYRHDIHGLDVSR